ncbi:alpha/beta hydrolase [Sphingomonas sp.]|jgi:pimeloyl-ACP methyl ester carboxylesterase|uniref:alpha/beta fold hydrolase n=1 Tax=Sphingomonas sp. TaxID=28214 RepID=UPI002E35D60E|nr:alpha/beta hydrolase [Sphingomonas sp.]HEX4692927.1 alpha/beta hydrolase [Sphingomonas sp.]
MSEEKSNTTRNGALIGLAAIVAVAGSSVAIARAVRAKVDRGRRDRGLSFGTARVHGAVLHFARSGRGPALILLHGFPQDWSEWRPIIARLARRFTVVAVDLRGIGQSTAGSARFDAATMAADVHGLASALKLERPYVVGHDIGGMVAHAYARLFPDDLRGAMILDVALPGLDGWDEAIGEPGAWHVGFLQTPDLPETLAAGRQDLLLNYFLRMGRHSSAQMDESLKAYASAAQFHAACEMYRAFPANAEFGREQRGANDVPIVYGTGDGSPFAGLADRIVAALKGSGFANVTRATVPDAVHYLVADNPDATAALIEQYA